MTTEWLQQKYDKYNLVDNRQRGRAGRRVAEQHRTVARARPVWLRQLDSGVIATASAAAAADSRSTVRVIRAGVAYGAETLDFLYVRALRIHGLEAGYSVTAGWFCCASKTDETHLRSTSSGWLLFQLFNDQRKQRVRTINSEGTSCMTTCWKRHRLGLWQCFHGERKTSIKTPLVPVVKS